MMREFKKLLAAFGLEYFNKFYGIYRGRVAANDDPEKRCRLQLAVPQVYDGVHDYWAEGRGMMSGTGTGFVAIPRVDDIVWVSFENGDPNYPIWEYGPFDQSPDFADTNYPDSYALQHISGSKIFIEGEGEEIRVELDNGIGLTINTSGVSLIRKGQKVSIGALNTSAEPALLGNKTEDVLQDIQQALATIQTMLGVMIPAYVPLGPPGALAVGTTLPPQLAQLVTLATSLTGKIALIKSKAVTLD